MRMRVWGVENEGDRTRPEEEEEEEWNMWYTAGTKETDRGRDSPTWTQQHRKHSNCCKKAELSCGKKICQCTVKSMFTLFPVFCIERTLYGLFLSQSTKKCYYLDRWGPQKAIRSGKASFPPFPTTQKNRDKGKWGHFHFSVLLSEPKNTEMRRKLEK